MDPGVKAARAHLAAVRIKRSVRPDYRRGGKGDLYDRNTCARYTISFFIALYVIAYALYGVLMINVNEINSWFTQPGDPCGSLVTTRYNNITYWAIALSCFRIFFMTAMIGIIGFKRVKGCTTGWIAVMMVVLSIDFFVWITLLSNVIGANTPGRPTMCDDLLKCNVAEFYNNPTPNWCLNTAATPRDIDLMADDLTLNSDCVWVFASNTVWLFLLDVPLIIMAMIIWYGYTSWERMDRTIRPRIQRMIRGIYNGKSQRQPHTPTQRQQQQHSHIPMPATVRYSPKRRQQVSPSPKTSMGSKASVTRPSQPLSGPRPASKTRSPKLTQDTALLRVQQSGGLRHESSKNK